ncbi:MAG: patatin-like phospholipase family protein [Spirochaetota bacterium]
MAIQRALVLSGGSIKGAFQAGALSSLLRRYEPDLVIGTSVGSLNGGFIVSRNGMGQSWAEAGESLVAFWRRRIRRLRDIGRRRMWWSVGLALALKRFDGLYDMTRLYDLVREEIGAQDIRASVCDFYACAVNIASGLARYAGKQDQDLLEYVIASTAIPILMPIKMVEGLPYWDGGIREVAPLKKAIDLGVSEIVCVACEPEASPPSDLTQATGPIRPLVDRLMQLVVNETLNNDIDFVRDVNRYLDACRSPSGLLATRRPIALTVVRPNADLNISLEHFDSADIERLIRTGIGAAESVSLPG